MWRAACLLGLCTIRPTRGGAASCSAYCVVSCKVPLGEQEEESRRRPKGFLVLSRIRLAEADRVYHHDTLPACGLRM